MFDIMPIIPLKIHIPNTFLSLYIVTASESFVETLPFCMVNGVGMWVELARGLNRLLPVSLSLFLVGAVSALRHSKLKRGVCSEEAHPNSPTC